MSIRLSSLGLSLLLLTGCSLTQPSAESRFFGLSAPALPTSHGPMKASAVVLVGPLTVADYLKRSALVSRAEDNAIAVASLDQWAGALEDEMQIALIQQLSTLQPDRLFLRYPGFGGTSATTPALALDVLRFDGRAGSEVRLEANWAWMNGEGEITSQGRFSQTQKSAGDLQALTQTQSQLLAALAKAVVAQLPK